MSPKERNHTEGGSRLPKPAQKEKRPAGQRTQKQKTLRVLYIVLTVIAAVIVVGFLFWNVFSAPPGEGELATRKPQTTTVIDEEGNEVEVEIPGLSADRKEQFYTFLLVGQDTYGGGNTDTMMLAAYDVPNQKLSVMSLPRDTFVNYNGRRVLLNSVYNRAGGAKDDQGITALKDAVGDLTGVTPDFYVIIQWEAVGTLVDAIDGVYFDVPRRMYYNDLTQNFKIDLQPGYQLLDGDKAMQLIRWRHNSDDRGHILNSGYATGDIGRIGTQQEFMKAIIAKCLQPEVLLTNLTEYISIFQKNVVTDLTVPNMAYFAKSAVGKLDMDSVAFMTMPYQSAGDGAHVLPVGSELLAAINEGFNPYRDDIRLSELKLVTSISSSGSSGSSSGSSGGMSQTVTPSPTPTPAATPTPSPTPGTEMPVTSPEGGEGGQTTAPPSESPGASEQPAPSPTPTPMPTPTPAATPAPSTAPTSGPGMEPVE